jgi:4,5-dihydroxyphthalate decarboxylase
MAPLPLTLACGDYDRTRPLVDGTVGPEGIDLTVLRLPVEEVFFRMLRHREFDVAELSLSSYVMTLFDPDPPFVALPVFPSRQFRHGAIYVNAEAGVRDPADLAGRVVGVPEYQITAAVWIRGILAERHGLPVAAPLYRTGGLEQPGRHEKIALSLPPDVRVEPIGPDQTLSQMLVAGELDALYTARFPSPFVAGAPEIRRLFADPMAVERQYLRDTGIFPIMHVVVVRRELHERHPWIAQTLTDAFGRAQQEAYRRLYETVALDVMLPWLTAHVEETRALMGADYWPYGLEANRRTLEAFLRYSHEQGLSARRLEPGELFAPQTHESTRI